MKVSPSKLGETSVTKCIIPRCGQYNMYVNFPVVLTVFRNFLADGGRVIFNACDQVQMKLTQLELNSVRLVTNGDCIGEGCVLVVITNILIRVLCLHIDYSKMVGPMKN